MERWKAVMLDGKVQSRKVAKAFLAEHGDQATARAAAHMREARKRRRAARALHWSRVALWIEELRMDGNKKEPTVKPLRLGGTRPAQLSRPNPMAAAPGPRATG